MNKMQIMAAGTFIAVSFLTPHVASAQQGVKRTDLQRHDLSVPGREVNQVLVEFDPGVSFPRHSHPGEEIVYVVEGSLEYALDGQPPVTLKAGEVLFIPTGTPHAVSNVGTARRLSSPPTSSKRQAAARARPGQRRSVRSRMRSDQQQKDG
jgi:quercetin dioxygenase-like cupin family protein